jgi:3-methyladenine DNA glycosylase AlkD
MVFDRLMAGAQHKMKKTACRSRIRERATDVIRDLRKAGDPAAVRGMARFGIETDRALGVSIPVLRKTARAVGRDHALAQALWDSDIHEARILASMVDEPGRVTPAQMDRWAADFDSWDLCDQCCSNLFDKTPWAWDKAVEWSAAERPFVKRAGFVLMAVLAVHDKRAENARFLPFFKRIERESGDDRNFVKKAVNWALRQMGKRNTELHRQAVSTARELIATGTRSGRWIGRNALRELERIRS